MRNLTGTLLCAIVPAFLLVWLIARRKRETTSEEAIETARFLGEQWQSTEGVMAFRRTLPLLTVSLWGMLGMSLIQDAPQAWFWIIGYPLAGAIFLPLPLIITVFAFNWPTWPVARRHREEPGYFRARALAREEENTARQREKQPRPDLRSAKIRARRRARK